MGQRLIQQILFCAVLGTLLPSCTARHERDLAKKTLTFSIGDDMKNMDPATAYDTVAMDVIPLALESLYQYTYTKTKPLVLEPLLADGLPVVSGDGKIYTVKIKAGVLWHDADFFPGGKGRVLRAKDFLFAWKRLALPELQSPGTWLFDGKVVGWDAFRKNVRDAKDPKAALEAPLEGFEALDENTLRIKLLKPYPQFPHILAMVYTAPMPREVFEKYGTFALNERLVGTGPYRFREYVRGSRFVLEKNPTFRGERYPSEGDDAAKAAGLLEAAGSQLPFVDEIIFRIFREDQPRWLSFSKGNLDVSGIPKDNFSSVVDRGELRQEMGAKGIQFLKLEQTRLFFLLFNMKDPLLGKNANLRKAISAAFDREAFVEKFRNGRGIRATSLVPRILPGYTARPTFEFDYNPALAKDLLAKAGFAEGKNLPTLKLDLRGASTNDRQQGEFIRDSLEKIGVKVEVVVNTLSGYLEKERNGNLQFVLGNWDSDYPDAENFLALLYGKNISPGPNVSNYVNPAYDRLYEKIALMEPSPERNKLILEAENLVYKDLPIAPLFYPLAFSVGHGWVKNFRPNIQMINHMKYFDVDLEKLKKLYPEL